MTIAALTKEDAHNLRHTLGADSRSPGFRNYYAADPGGKDEESFRWLEAAGLAQRGIVSANGLQHWHATDLACALLGITVAT